MRSFLIFAVIQLTVLGLGMSDSETIALVIFALAVLIFGSVFIPIFLKDRLQKKRFVRTVLGS